MEGELIIGKILPERNIWDSIQTSPDFRGNAGPDGHYLQVPIKRSWFRSFWCKHYSRVQFQRTDHRGGPGWMSDSFAGTCCQDCGLVLEERQTY